MVAFAPVRLAIIDAAEQGPSAVAAAVAAFEGDATLEALSFQPAVLADLAGQMYVRLIEAADAPTTVELADPIPAAAFLRMTFEEALAWWKQRGGSDELLRDVLGAYRERAAEYTRDQLDTISRTAIAEIDRTLASGGTLRDFQTALIEGTTTLGIEAANPSYLENVYRTQVASAYGAGRWAQMNDPDVLEARPFRQYHTAQDSRVRSEHAPMDGVTWRADDAAFAAIATPCGFQCRCAIITLSAEELADGGYSVSTSVPAGFVLTPGFGASSFVR